jgi:PAS domain S-box-containing protein
MLALVVGVAVVLLLIFGFLFMLFSSRIANARSRIESILDTTSQGYIMIDADGIIVDCNPAMLAMLGLQEQSIVGQHVRKFVDDAEAKMHGNYQIDLNLRRADGSQIQSLVNGSTVLDTSQGKQFSFALFSDITERKHAEESLRASEERNRAITQSAFDAIVTSDNTGNIVGWNNGAEVIFGYPELEAMGQPLILLIPERYREGHLTGMHRFNSGGESHVIGKTVELNGLRKDGSEFPLELTLAKWESTDGWFITAIIGDITERKQMEKQLLQSEKLASIGQLAAGVAHEINNPIGFVNSNLGTLKHYVDDLLAVISAYESVETDSGSSTDLFAAVNALKTELDLAYVKEDVSSLLAESSDGLDRVKRIVQGLKDFSHIDAIETWKIDDIQQGIESTLNVVWNELKYKCEVRKEYGELPPVECMLANLNQVFMNLLVNAAHAIEDHGIVTIRTGRKDDEVWVEIADTGKGIPSGNLLHIFDPFFTTKPVGQGTGLGLSVSYGIVAKHHGRIEVDSEVGKGSTFRVWLPIRQPTKGKDTQTTVSSS